jgi:hypothetical protein
MKHIYLGLLLLGGCGATPDQWVAGGALVGIGSIAVLGRTPADAVVSVVTGRDCSVVHWDKGKSYCKPEEPPPDPPVFCTRSLGRVDCWEDPASLPGHPKGVADGPSVLTPAQEKDRTKGWVF